MSALTYRIEYWDEDRKRWNIQSMGQANIDYIMSDWEGWVDSRFGEKNHYRLILIVTTEVILKHNRE